MTSGRPQLTYFISSLDMGGAQRGMARLLSGLIDEYDVTVVTLRGGDRSIVPELPGEVMVVDLNIQNLRQVTVLRELLPILTETDVLVCSLYHATVVGTVLGRLSGVSNILVWQHNSKFRSLTRRHLFGIACRLSAQVLADSEAVSSMLNRRFNFSEQIVSTVPIAGIDTERFAPVDTTRTHETTVGILGRLVEQKNHEAVLDAAADLQDFSIQFEIAGKGPRETELKRRARERDLDNVSFRGFVDDVPKFLAGLDIYVQPSNHEGLCITAVEAMSCGLPVVGSDVDGLSGTIEDGETGFFFAPNRTDAFIDRIRYLHQNPERQVEMGKHARQNVIENYSQVVLQQSFRDALLSVRSDQTATSG